MSEKFGTEKYWRKLARDSRKLAVHISFGSDRENLEAIANEYDDLADRAAEEAARAIGKPKPSSGHSS